MRHDIDADWVWKSIEATRVCLLVTSGPGLLRARPMTPLVRRTEFAIHFLAGTMSSVSAEVRKTPRVLLAFARPLRREYVALSATVSISNDRGKIRELWSPAARVWWDTPEGEDVRLLIARPGVAQCWAGGGMLAALAAQLAGTDPKAVRSHEVQL